ncbi:MAG: DUF4294 domain-containing protein [Rikenellaceae bacterium]|nr:DUF4294 domain-containing protein [Rikenellaceae bacterium]MBR4055812.1 DUF4294 domain-containing protein [Rikenellaceae bacterium]
MFAVPTWSQQRARQTQRQQQRQPQRQEQPQPQQSKRARGYTRAWVEVEQGDSVQNIAVLPIYVFRRPADLRKYQRMVIAVKKTYPIAKVARQRMAEMEEKLLTLPTRKAQKAYTKQVEQQIKEEYTPVLKKMTRSQGKVLLKLIARETEYSSYEIVREFRGGFTAGFWQGVAKIFGANLKTEYDREDEDRMLEQIVTLYEAGLL